MVNNTTIAAVLVVQTSVDLPPPLQTLIANGLLSVAEDPPPEPHLVYDTCVQLVQPNTKIKPISVDFLAGKHRHRRNFGGGKNQLLCKAVGIKTGFKPRVVDMTAGLGGDAFVLATMGCQVHMIERAPLAAALLSDGLYRLQQQDPEIAELLSLSVGDSRLTHLEHNFDVAYLDPMYPDHSQKAAVNKSMTAFREMIGKDDDADDLFAAAVAAQVKRVVVKRPKAGVLLNHKTPSYQLAGKSSRYDVYAFQKLG